MQYILTRNTKKAFGIDDCDYFRLSLFKWYERNSRGGTIIQRNKGVGFLSNSCKISLANEIFGTKRLQYDHKDRNPLNNSKCNLRVVTNKQNSANTAKHKDGSSRYKGVSWNKDKKKWAGKIQSNGKHYNLGYFDNEKEAALLYNLKAKELFGEFAFLNII